MKTSTLQIKEERLWSTIDVSASIGGTDHHGLHRLALSKEDKKMRETFIQWLEAENLTVRIDDFGNIYGRREGKNDNAPAVAMGSHLDTQPYGGRFDGVVGVLSALEVIRVLNENNMETEHPIEIINFTNEEGARFGPPMLGSGGVTGAFTKEFVYKTQDAKGVSYEQALIETGFQGKQQNRIQNIKNFVELHIEQGPILESREKQIGVVQGIQGMSWLSVTVKGEANHAGPTPMENRKDALAPAAKMISAVQEFTGEHSGLKTTVGKMDITPNVPNVIPGEVVFTVDIRHQSDSIRRSATESLKERMSAIASNNNVDITIVTEWESDAVQFSTEVIESVERGIDNRDYSSMELFSGPGHDAKYMAGVAETGMIFIPSKDGISHNEAEFSKKEDIAKGTTVLLEVIYDLAKAKNIL